MIVGTLQEAQVEPVQEGSQQAGQEGGPHSTFSTPVPLEPVVIIINVKVQHEV